MSPLPPHFDPNSAAVHGGVFGLPHGEDDAAVVYIPVPWDATTSYRRGTAKGPAAIRAASVQVDLYEHHVERPYAAGLFMSPEPEDIRKWNDEAGPLAARVMESDDPARDPDLGAARARVNALSEAVAGHVRAEVGRLLDADKVVGLVGGEHSVSLGALQAQGERCASFGVLHVDAHCDTRDAYQGFVHSHASIMRNALDRIPAIERLVQVGIRDCCDAEIEYARAQGDRVHVFHDVDMSRRKLEGTPFGTLAREILEPLPQDVWISFDVDGLDPSLCPNTGTPVPGGLDFAEATFLLAAVARSGRRILGFDLCEVAPAPGWPDGGAASTGAVELVDAVGEARREAEGSSLMPDSWDAIVGTRLLYKLTAWTLASRGLAAFTD